MVLNNELGSLLLNSLIKVLENEEVVEFDLVCYEDCTVEQINSEGVDNFRKIQELIGSIENSQPMNANEIDYSVINGYCIVIKNSENEKITFYKKYSHSKVLKHGFQLFANAGTLNKFVSDVIPIDERVDVFYVDNLDNQLYILNRYMFETLFSYNDNYRNILENALKEIETDKIIKGFDEFKEACLGNNKIAKKFTKIMSENGLRTFKDNITRIQSVIKDYELSVQFTDGKLIYEDKSSLPDIIKLLSNDFVRAALDNGRYEAPKKKRR